jgi:phenylalanine-4-hydroxylase
MNADKIPNYDDLNAALGAATDWSIHVVPGLIPVEEFFKLLAQRKFPASTWLRKPEELDYLEEPDMFHDIFGHIPLLLDPQYAQFMEDFGKHGVANLKKSHIIRQLQNLYWFTIEFGVCKDPTKIYGAGIISSFGETNHIFAPKTTIYPFDLEKVLGNSFINSEIQGHYYRIGGLEAVYEIDFKHIH